MGPVHPRVQRIPRDLIDRFHDVPPATLGHVLTTGFMDSGIRPLFKGVRVVGSAVTLKMPPGDSFLTRQAIEILEPGDVLVIDQGGDPRASWGEMTSLAAQVRGAAGVIVDGAVTDVVEIEEQRMPTFARHVAALVGKRLGLGGGINLPVSCGGVVVQPGDLVVADENGIVVIPPERAEEAYAKGRADEDRAPYMRIWLRNGGSLSDLADLDAGRIAEMVRERGWA